MTDYIIEAKSRKDLRAYANYLRKILKLENALWVPIVELLDVLGEICENFSYEIVPDDAMPNSVHAETNVLTGHVTIKESVYENACDGEGRDRMTIAHEIGHYFTICQCGFKFQRNFTEAEIKPYNDPEWQAKCFAGEFMIPSHLIGKMLPGEIAEVCGVSYDAAYYQYRCNNRKE